MNQSRRGFLKSVLGLAVAQAFIPPARLVDWQPVALSDEFTYLYGKTVTGRFSSTGFNIQDLPKSWDRAKMKDAMFLTNYAVIEERLLSQMAAYRYAIQHMGDYLHDIYSPDQAFRLLQTDYHPMDMLPP